MIQDDLIAYFQTKDGTTSSPDAAQFAQVKAAEIEAGRPFAPADRALICAVGGVDHEGIEFADPDPALTVGDYAKRSNWARLGACHLT